MSLASGKYWILPTTKREAEMATKPTKGVAIKTDKTGKVRVVPKMTGKTLNQQYASKNRKRYRGVK